MRVVLFFDQIQAGAGGKERPNVPLAVEKGGIGAYLTFSTYLTNANVIATTYCGTSYFDENKEEVKIKMIGLLKKVKADIILCGPCYNYEPFAKMATEMAKEVKDKLPECKSIVMCSKENEEIINKYKNELIMLKMPKKGGVGLSESFRHLAEVMEVLGNNENHEKIKKYMF
ncbi:GrdB-related putative oxidoreductase [Oceanivirga salmonicida]|uniref:GrdB-related putative oxidoreductase n=1 Tax=Oceanivirga salmonicida TaxID=1769291 RepID=UPI00082D57A2|nr:GrdB-related putative oxidoreductase [Oceanivirga salmonicida]